MAFLFAQPASSGYGFPGLHLVNAQHCVVRVCTHPTRWLLRCALLLRMSQLLASATLRAASGGGCGAPLLLCLLLGGSGLQGILEAGDEAVRSGVRGGVQGILQALQYYAGNRSGEAF